MFGTDPDADREDGEICDYTRSYEYKRDVKRGLKLLYRIYTQLQESEAQEMLDFTSIKTAIAGEQTVDGGVATLLNQLSAQITTLAQNQEDPANQAMLETLAGEINQDTAGVSAAVTANTPSAPPAATDPNAPTDGSGTVVGTDGTESAAKAAPGGAARQT
jgi:hypothetical protein